MSLLVKTIAQSRLTARQQKLQVSERFTTKSSIDHKALLQARLDVFQLDPSPKTCAKRVLDVFHGTSQAGQSASCKRPCLAQGGTHGVYHQEDMSAATQPLSANMHEPSALPSPDGLTKAKIAQPFAKLRASTPQIIQAMQPPTFLQESIHLSKLPPTNVQVEQQPIFISADDLQLIASPSHVAHEMQPSTFVLPEPIIDTYSAQHVELTTGEVAGGLSIMTGESSEGITDLLTDDYSFDFDEFIDYDADQASSLMSIETNSVDAAYKDELAKTAIPPIEHHDMGILAPVEYQEMDIDRTATTPPASSIQAQSTITLESTFTAPVSMRIPLIKSQLAPVSVPISATAVLNDKQKAARALYIALTRFGPLKRPSEFPTTPAAVLDQGSSHESTMNQHIDFSGAATAFCG